jgi:hypothetical protein
MKGALAAGALLVVGLVSWLMWDLREAGPTLGEVQSSMPEPADDGLVDADDGLVDADDGLVDAGGSALSSGRARELERGVNARDSERLGEVVLLGEQDPVEVAEEALPDGARLVIEEDTFEEVDGGGAVVVARVVGEQEFAVRLLLVEVEGRWMLGGSSEPEPVP